MGRILRSWAIYTLVLIAWLGVVPVTACRIYRIVFSASLSNILSLPFQLFSLENLLVDCLKVSCLSLNLATSLRVLYFCQKAEIARRSFRKIRFFRVALLFQFSFALLYHLYGFENKSSMAVHKNGLI